MFEHLWKYHFWYYAECHYAECHYAECHFLLTVMLSVVTLSIVMVNVFKLGVIMLSVVPPFLLCLTLAKTVEVTNSDKSTLQKQLLHIFAISVSLWYANDIVNKFTDTIAPVLILTGPVL